MIDSNRALRVVHPMPGLEWTEIRDAAVGYAQLGWPVLPGTYQLSERPTWLGKPGAMGLEPVAKLWSLACTTDPVLAMEWWTRRPYSVLLACGQGVDALEVPAAHGQLAQHYLATRGQLGPNAVTPFGTWLMFVRTGGELLTELATHVQLYSQGSWVPLPPTRREAVPYRWRMSRQPDARPLPNTVQVQRAVLDALEELDA